MSACLRQFRYRTGDLLQEEWPSSPFSVWCPDCVALFEDKLAAAHFLDREAIAQVHADALAETDAAVYSPFANSTSLAAEGLADAGNAETLMSGAS